MGFISISELKMQERKKLRFQYDNNMHWSTMKECVIIGLFNVYNLIMFNPKNIHKFKREREKNLELLSHTLHKHILSYTARFIVITNGSFGCLEMLSIPNLVK